MSKFQVRLHNLRIEHGYSLESLADELNKRFNASFNKGMLSKYESGKTIPDFKNIPLLAEVFGVSVDYIIGVSDTLRHSDIPVLEAPDNHISSLEDYQKYDPEEIKKALKMYEQYKGSIPQVQAAVETLLNPKA